MKIMNGISNASILAAAISIASTIGCARYEHPVPARADEIPAYEAIPDPFEPVNRSISVVNHLFMVGIVTPTSKVYRFILPLPVRDSIRRFGYNLAFPVRLANNLLQGEFEGAGVETNRFLVNTTLGLLGLFDPASDMGIGRSEEDLGQTFGAWGWKPQAYLMLPVLGPSNERDFLGRLGDAFLDPAEYLFPAAPFFAYNDIVYKVDPYHNLIATEYDPYSLMRIYVSLERQKSVLDFPFDYTPDDEAVQTLNYAIYFNDDDFAFHKAARSGKIRLASPDRSLPYSCWLQPGEAPMVYLLPGLGAHRLSHGNVMLAKAIHEAGYSVATISNIMHPEFIANGSSVGLPGYLPADAKDVRQALTALRQELRWRYPGRIKSEALMGVSLGGIVTLAIAAGEENRPPAERFARYVAINTPVSLYNGMQRLDEYFNAPLAWPPEERPMRIEHTLMKLKDLDVDELDSEERLPFDSAESRFLIGYSFRTKLRDILFVSQRRNNLGVLRSDLSWLRRASAYEEIMRYSYRDYFEKFVFPYFSSRIPSLTRESFLWSADLRAYGHALAANPNCRVVNNRNDFLATADDMAFLESVFAPSRLVVFEEGGHMGNFHHSEVQQAILDTLKGVR